MNSASEIPAAPRSDGRVVLVTGAGGSIGSELCRQVAARGAMRVILLDHAENSVFEVDRSLRDRFPALQVVPVVADVRDARRLSTVFDRYRPDTVYHAAAYKHVPLMEQNPAEAVTSNVAGTLHVVECAGGSGVGTVVLLSTDKAVRPVSVMGATKRIAEVLVHAEARRTGRRYLSVRFGNVLDSRGSVLPIFREQIARGGPVTVTDPEMRRYFMSIPEAVELVLEAGEHGIGGEVITLAMGEPVRILDLARMMIREAGLEEGRDIEIRFTGTRPGEKLLEEPLPADGRIPGHPRLLRTEVPPPTQDLLSRVDALIRLAEGSPEADGAIRDALRALVPEYSPAETKT